MIYKQRTESDELLKLRSLNARMELEVGKKQYYSNIKKGYEGEVMFDTHTEKLQCECLVLNDLLLKHRNTTFQIDSLIITERLYLFDVKNFTGDYLFDDNQLFHLPKTEVENPVVQLQRCHSLLRQLLSGLGYNMPIESWVVFINPDFYLYQAPLTLPVIFPTQVNRHLQKLDATPSRMNGRQNSLVEKLVAQSTQNYLDSPYTQVPKYRYEDLRQGMMCMKCHSISLVISGKKLCCTGCGSEEKVEAAVIRSEFEFKLLFPGEKITTSGIFRWCGGVVSDKWVHGILERNFKKHWNSRWTYYE
ncbi:nuclease-related domain-containing protein [Bacillus sp. B-jedd]|uniref:nuclease-related domain-containing protein n=1 Tax=Bacillus sp. B-jedd TaxID=1476857 RepID=UPI0005155D4F|nr:nuclease-related domain-containing protein [Bacillus sp. B-jedd]CEG28866.1 NERD domain-containing protein [Bacillus sp. B-jedd]